MVYTSGRASTVDDSSSSTVRPFLALIRCWVHRILSRISQRYSIQGGGGSSRVVLTVSVIQPKLSLTMAQLHFPYIMFFYGNWLAAQR